MLAFDSVDAWSVTVTILNSRALGSEFDGVLGAGGVTAARVTTGAYVATEPDGYIERIEAMRITGVPTDE